MAKPPRGDDTSSSEGASYGTPQQNSWRTTRDTRDARESLRGSPPASSSSDYNQDNTLPCATDATHAALLPATLTQAVQFLTHSKFSQMYGIDTCYRDVTWCNSGDPITLYCFMRRVMLSRLCSVSNVQLDNNFGWRWNRRYVACGLPRLYCTKSLPGQLRTDRSILNSIVTTS